jgi:DNA repair protein RadC
MKKLINSETQFSPIAANFTDNQILERAAEILFNKNLNKEIFVSSKAAAEYLKVKLGAKEEEVFAVMFLDSQHRLIEYDEMFKGSISSATVYPRMIVKKCIEVNAAAILISHNHPSGDPTPSQADKNITRRIKTILEIIDVNLLDHIVVGESTVSFTEHGYL